MDAPSIASKGRMTPYVSNSGLDQGMASVGFAHVVRLDSVVQLDEWLGRFFIPSSTKIPWHLLSGTGQHQSA